MSETQNAVEVAQPSKAPVLFGKSGIIISDLDSLWRFSCYVQKSGLAPKGIQTNEAIFVAIQMGLEVGLTPMAALQNIAVINGRPSIWGDAQLAVVRGTGELELFEEWFEAGGQRLSRNPATYTDDTCAVCRVKRRGFEASEISFSVADAKLANLWGKDGPWRQYPWRMMRMRARSFALRDQFGDALRGMRTVEENSDIPEERSTPAVVVRVDPVERPAISAGEQPVVRHTAPPEAATQTSGEGSADAASAPRNPPQQDPPAQVVNSRLHGLRRWLGEAGIPEGRAMDQIHKMFPEASDCSSMEEVELAHPNVINAILRAKTTFATAVNGKS